MVGKDAGDGRSPEHGEELSLTEKQRAELVELYDRVRSDHPSIVNQVATEEGIGFDEDGNFPPGASVKLGIIGAQVLRRGLGFVAMSIMKDLKIQVDTKKISGFIMDFDDYPDDFINLAVDFFKQNA